MAQGNASVEAIDFDRVRRGDHTETGNGLELVWEALNEEINTRSRSVRNAVNRSERQVLEIAQTVSLNDLDIGDASIIAFTGAASVNVTGFLAPSGFAARLLTIFVLGAGTITLKHNVTSEAPNRILTFSAGDLAIATNKCVDVLYLNTRWREKKFA